MAWFSRSKSPSTPVQPEVKPFDATPAREQAPRGRYGPIVRITSFDEAPEELTWQLPVRGELFRLMPGPDRPDYSVMLLERPLRFYPPAGFDFGRVDGDRLVEDRQGRRMVEVHALVLTARFVGQQLHEGMVELPVNVAYVLDHSLVDDAAIVPAKIEYAAVGLLSEGGGEGESATTAGSVPAARSQSQPDDLVESVGRDVAAVLREGVAARRGTPVERLTAVLTLDSARRLSGLSGNADGAAPEPTPETFDRINAALSRLSALPPDRAVSTLTVQVQGDHVTVESSD